MTLFELATLLDVTHNAALMPATGRTLCNAYASVFCAARGARLPPLLANEQLTFLQASPEWARIGRGEAVTRANAHELVVAAVAAVPHGHIAPVVESPDGDPMGCYVTAAGARNYVRCTVETSFGPMFPVYFVHQGATNG